MIINFCLLSSLRLFELSLVLILLTSLWIVIVLVNYLVRLLEREGEMSQFLFYGKLIF